MLGGTFDPPHIGHLVVACEVRLRLALDEVRLIPARLPPHKPDGAHGTADQRLGWTQALVAGRPGLSVADDELTRPGPSYSADTMAAIAASSSDADLWFILGADQLEALPTWHQPQRLLASARIAVVPREGYSGARVASIAGRVAPGRVDVVDAPRIDISSTMLRARMRAGESVRHLVGDAVCDRLVEDGLVASIADTT